MKNRLLIPFLALIVVLVIVAFNTVFIVRQTEQVLVLQFGNPVRPIRTPGLEFKWPYQNVVRYDKRILDVEPPAEEVNAADQKRLVVDSYARYQISDPLQFFQTIGSGDVARETTRTRLGSIIGSTLRRVIGNVPLASVVAERRAEVMRQVRDEVNLQARSFGINVIDVRIKRADLPTENSQAIFERMKTERQREAAQFRAEGAREAQKIRSNADRQRVEIIAEAQKQAQILRGEGDAESVRVYADAFNRDPEFFAFYRSLEAYRDALANRDTTLVLSPDSEFFRFFGSVSGGAPGGGDKPRR